MKPDKPPEAKLPNPSDIHYNGAASAWLEAEEPDLARQRSRVRTIISRAATVYLVLFLMLGGPDVKPGGKSSRQGRLDA